MMFLSALALATAVFSTVATATDPNKWPPVPTWLPEHGTSNWPPLCFVGVQEQTSGFQEDIGLLRTAPPSVSDSRSWIGIDAGPGNCQIIKCTSIGFLPDVIQRTGAAVKVCNDKTIPIWIPTNWVADFAQGIVDYCTSPAQNGETVTRGQLFDISSDWNVILTQVDQC
ncbi:hypothetical protein BGZ61DRAFT_465593 [Ilyonectria robusta]|uniref:uncharacterized protein n=1 Tax=Ilyonectria robusta TaxID=1079257 RepID=UPI001E8C9F52|nr:uncharacterized protein BGZ61DRAFT_465593 [Ilyonectria robusta]KAH6974390.1 hypothetical protein BKA56DRAFT_591264 [Ilyonectria sp. MPI-CAGE-AT-0026]KAH8659010.1 hypothetical protein BGZ61DRAFT_465593 [Ilyonectria robusta]